MKSIAWIVLLTLLIAFPAGSRSAVASETVDVPRVDGRKALVLRPVVHWPPGKGPFGAVVVVNSSAGKNDIFLRVTHAAFNKLGIAVAYLDTFTPRGITDTVSDQTKITSTVMAMDALHVADVLRKDARIKPDKVALLVA